MPTYIPKADAITRKWYVIDAKGQVLGKLAAAAALVLTGKRKPIYTPFLDTGDHVIVINAGQVHLSGRKEEGKFYHRHTRLPGRAQVHRGRRRAPQAAPAAAWRTRCAGMLPKTKLGRAMFTKLKVYAGDKHPHEAQKPQPIVPQEVGAER